MKVNTAPSLVNTVTHEGAPAVKESAEKELVRAVSACMLWEDTFYESGSNLAARIADLVGKVSLKFGCELAVKARTDLKLRHVPLFLCAKMLAKAGDKKLLGETIGQVIQRADEPGELLAMYWQDGRKSVPRQLKRGIALAFPKFDEYQLAKYDRAAKVRLRDALFISHAKPKDEEQAALWKRLVANELKVPDTWEVALSGGADKKEAFTRLLAEKKLGYLALLRNLRNMTEAGVENSAIVDAMKAGAAKSKALPFRFIAAARACPQLAEPISEAMMLAVAEHAKLPGLTYLLIDVSGSMDGKLSGKSDLSRIDAAAALAVLCREICSQARVFTFSNQVVEVQAFRGLAMIQGVHQSQPHGGTETGMALNTLKTLPRPNRVIVVTDEQSRDSIPACWANFGYVLNVATYEPALPITGAGWTRISGFSERVVDWMMAEESQQ